MEDLFAVRVCGEAGAVVECLGEMDICAESPLRDALDRAMNRCPEGVRVDLSEVRYIDSACIAVLLRARDHLAARGGRLAITALSPVAQRAFHLLGLDQGLCPTRLCPTG